MANLESEYKDLKFISFEPKIEMTSVLAWKGKSVMSDTVKAFIEYCVQNINKES